MKRFLWPLLLSLLFTVTTVRADDPDSAYIDIYRKIMEADSLLQNGDTNAAFGKYIDAQKDLLQFDKKNRHWNDTIVTFRQNYLTEKINALASAAETAPAPKAAKAATKGNGSKPAEGAFKLLSAGAEPRQVLRLHAKAGDKQSANMTLKTSMTTEAPGVPAQPMKLPGVVTPMDILIQNVADNGDITYQSIAGEPTILDEPGALPGVADAMKAAISGMKGMTTTATISSRGFTKGMNVNLPAGMAPQARNSVEQMKDAMDKVASPFPEEAVGQGAQWEYKQQMKSQGMTIDQTTTYELVSVDGDTITLRCTITQTAANQVIANPSMPGVKVELTKLSGTGSGTLTRNLSQLIPATGSLDEKMDVAMTIPTGQQKQSMSMNMDMNIAFESK